MPEKQISNQANLECTRCKMYKCIIYVGMWCTKGWSESECTSVGLIEWARATEWEKGRGREWKWEREREKKGRKIKTSNRLSTIYFSIVPNHNFAQQQFQWQKWTNQYVQRGILHELLKLNGIKWTVKLT